MVFAELFNGGQARVGKAGKKGNDKAFQGPEYGHGGNGLLALIAQDDIHHHVAYAEEHLITEDGEALPADLVFMSETLFCL